MHTEKEVYTIIARTIAFGCINIILHEHGKIFSNVMITIKAMLFRPFLHGL